MSKDQVKDELVKVFKTSLTAEVVHCFITTVLFRVAKRWPHSSGNMKKKKKKVLLIINKTHFYQQLKCNYYNIFRKRIWHHWNIVG